VAYYDAPGVGTEPRTTLTREAIADRGVLELERRGWDTCVVASDGNATATAVKLAHKWSGNVEGMVLGHAKLSYDMGGERPTMNRQVWEAFGQLVRQDYAGFIRYGLTQLTHGSIGDELAGRMLERVPPDIAHLAWEEIYGKPEPIEDLLRQLDVPLLFAEHKGCLVSTSEGFEDAVAAFPEAETVSVEEAPPVSAEFGEALQSFCYSISEARSRSNAG
jgi:hypothetical protein